MSLSTINILGTAGDFIIDNCTAIINKKISHLVIGASTAYIAVAKIRGIDVSTIRNYKKLDPGYVMYAGDGEYFDTIQFAGLERVQAFYYKEPPAPNLTTINVNNGSMGTTMTPRLVYTNPAAAGSKNVAWRVKNASSLIVQSGSAMQYFPDLTAANSSVGFVGPTYYSTDASNMRFEASFLDDVKPVWVTSPPFQVYP